MVLMFDISITKGKNAVQPICFALTDKNKIFLFTVFKFFHDCLEDCLEKIYFVKNIF